MDKKELRIGNIVGATIAGEIHGELAEYVIKSGADIDNSHWYFPTQITEKHLIRFGFKSKKHIYEKENAHGKIHFDVGTKSIFIEYDDTFVCVNEEEIEYVHQLQNAYFVLTSKELRHE